MLAKLGELNSKTEKHFGLGGPGPWKEPVILIAGNLRVAVTENDVTLSFTLKDGSIKTKTFTLQGEQY